jgi:hypothetical protein
MFSIFRKLLVIVLTMLQFIAPLVHAHASEPVLNQGLHVPGLEFYSTDHNILKIQAKGLTSNIDLEGMVVAVDLGVKQSFTKLFDNPDIEYFIHQKGVIFHCRISRYEINFSPQPRLVNNTILTSPHSPRAPPFS